MHVDPRNLVLHFTSPTGHRYAKNPRPPLIPDLRVDSNPAATRIARQLDTHTMYAAAAGTPAEHRRAPPSTAEHRRATYLLRQALNTAPREYIPDPTFWETTNTQVTGPGAADADGDTANQSDVHDSGDDDELAPPF